MFLQTNSFVVDIGSNTVFTYNLSQKYKMDISRSRSKDLQINTKALLDYVNSTNNCDIQQIGHKLHIDTLANIINNNPDFASESKLKVKHNVSCLTLAMKKNFKNPYRVFKPEIEFNFSKTDGAYSVLGSVVYKDLYVELEKTGITAEGIGKKPIICISLEYSLDTLLHIICGADPKNIRKLPDYNEISLLSTNCALHLYKGKDNLNMFSGLDVCLDSYLANLVKAHANSSDKDLTVLTEFYYDVLSTASAILNVVTDCLYSVDNFSLRGHHLATMVCGITSSHTNVPNSIQFKSNLLDFCIPVIHCGESGYKEVELVV